MDNEKKNEALKMLDTFNFRHDLLREHLRNGLVNQSLLQVRCELLKLDREKENLNKLYGFINKHS